MQSHLIENEMEQWGSAFRFAFNLALYLFDRSQLRLLCLFCVLRQLLNARTGVVPLRQHVL